MNVHPIKTAIDKDGQPAASGIHETPSGPRRGKISRPEHSRRMDNHAVEPTPNHFSNRCLAKCLRTIVGCGVGSSHPRAGLIDHPRCGVNIEGVDRTEMNEALNTRLECGLGGCACPPDIDVGNEAASVPVNRVDGCEMENPVDIAKTIEKRSFVTNVALDPLDRLVVEQFKPRGRKGTNLVPVADQLFHEV
jgi:hypothetical protein